MAACCIEGLYQGTLMVTPDTARALMAYGVIVPTDTLGVYALVDDMEDRLWAKLRKMAREA